MSGVRADSCRLCLETSALTSMFSTEGGLSLPEKAIACLGIKVQSSAGLQPLICPVCKDKLNNFYEFRLKCRAIDKQIVRAERRQHKLKEECVDASFDGCKLEMKPEFDGLILNGLDQLEDWLPDDSKHSFENNDVKRELCIDNLSESLQRTLAYEIKVESNGITCNIETENTQADVQNYSLENKSSEVKKPASVPVQCELCGRIFKHKTILKKHLRTHSGVKLFSCKICSKKFTRAEHETVHMRAHRGIRPFVCEVCARAFTKRQDLLRHMRIHSDEKKYPCPRCERRFKRSGDVQSHLRSHTGAKPYSCGGCDKTYSSHSGLKKHFRAHCSEPGQSKFSVSSGVQ